MSSAPGPGRHHIAIVDSPWRLILLIALPYWVIVNALLNVTWELFATGGNGSLSAAELGFTLEVRIVHDVLMAGVVLSAYRLALSIGWPIERRWLALLGHIGTALLVALASRPLFLCSVRIVLGWDVDWARLLAPTNDRVLQLWGSMGLGYLLPYLLGLALIVGAQILNSLRRSELERATLQNAWTQAQLQTLRMQLNPHFLFNTFNAIAMLLDSQPQSARARELVLALSDLYRRTLIAAEREWMTVTEEIEMAGDYLRVQAARFDGRLAFEIECNPALARARLPALILQPLVENAVVHGRSDSRDHLRIWIRAVESSTASGEPAVLIEVGNETTGPLGSSPGVGIGLRNTRSRLAACYGDLVRFDTETTGPSTFLARLRIPLQMAR